jgi:hypothetical protein
MSDPPKTWSLLRYIYFGAGLLIAMGTIWSFIWETSATSYIFAVVALLVLAVAVLGSDNLLSLVHRAFWHRQWPK